LTSCYAALFFFSSRRRHTRFSRDWSSDVCSSDLSSSTYRPLPGSPGSATIGRSRDASISITFTYPASGSENRPSHSDSARARSRSEERRVGEEGGGRAAGDEENNSKDECMSGAAV